MTREWKERLPLIQAFVDGEVIEVLDYQTGKWDESECIAFTSIVDEYRIKLMPKYRPFKDANECFEEMLKHQPFGWVYADLLNEFNGALMQITLINNKGYRFVTDRQDRSYSDAFEINSVYFADGTPFGIKEEE